MTPISVFGLFVCFTIDFLQHWIAIEQPQVLSARLKKHSISAHFGTQQHDGSRLMCELGDGDDNLWEIPLSEKSVGRAVCKWKNNQRLLWASSWMHLATLIATCIWQVMQPLSQSLSNLLLWRMYSRPRRNLPSKRALCDTPKNVWPKEICSYVTAL